MTWLLIAAIGCLAWLSAAWFFVALCRAAGQADHSATGIRYADPAIRRAGNVVELRPLREVRGQLAVRGR